MEKCKKLLLEQKLNILVLILITIFSCIYISQKEGYHMDELLSFELANAEFTPWIVTTQPEGRLEKFVQNEIYGDTFGETASNLMETVKDVIQNRGNSKLLQYTADVYEEPQWITAEQFENYITTDKRDSFNYLSVYFNVKDDNHPPLHFMALHTISSIFKGQIHPWMGCIINLVLILGICILFMRISSEILERPGLGIAVSILYACSMAGLATLLLIRMYAMLTFWCVFALYIHLQKMKSGEWNGHNKLLILITVCGFVTQYYFVIFMVFLAATVVLLLRNKNILYYLRSMVISAVIGLAIYPFSIKHVLYSGRGIESVQNLGSGLDDLGERFTSFVGILVDRTLGGSIVLVILAVVLIIACGVALLKSRKLPENQEDRAGIPLKTSLVMIAVPTLGYFLLVTKIAPYYEDRYMMPIFPMISFLLGFLIYMVAEKLLVEKKAELATIILAILLVIPAVFTQTPGYLYKGYETQVDLARTYQNLPCVCVYDGVGYYQNLIEFTQYKETLMTTVSELVDRSEDTILQENQELVVLLEGSVEDKEVDTYLSQTYGYKKNKVLLEEGVHGDTLYLYTK